MAHTWAKDYIKHDWHDVEPVYIFLSVSGGTSKSHLVNVTHSTTPRTLLYHCKDTEKPRVLLLGPTGISAVNIGGTTIQCGLGIKPGTKLLVLNDKFKADLKKSEIIRDEIINNRCTFYGIK